MLRRIPTTGYRALRTNRVSLPGHLYLVTTTTHRRERFFAEFSTARLAVTALNHRETLADSEILAWVLMPDHLHLLVQLGEEDELSALMNRIKSRMGRVVNRHLARTGPAWQCGFHEHVLRREEDIKGVARYIILNPVRAGLVGRVSDYPHWDAAWL
ncbi:MAG: REP-associated tyrosine transposase [Burkholderiales bacterium]